MPGIELFETVGIKDRVCSLCNVIEDEFHCRIECPRYDNVMGNGFMVVVTINNIIISYLTLTNQT